MDVKDTINQWCEAQIMEIRNGEAYIHYNGWGTRWDEWVGLDTDRIKAFRSHTIQGALSNYLSPFPSIPPDAFNNASLSNEHSLDRAPEEIISLSQQTSEMMSQLQSMKRMYKNQMKR